MGLRESCDPWRPYFLISTSSLVMIQRIQSLYLLIGIVLLALVFFLPVWSWTAAADNLYYNFSPFGVSTNDTNFSSPLWFSLLMVVSVGGALALDTWALFAFKSQARQMTLIVFAQLLIVGFYGTLLWQWFTLSPDLPQGAFNPGLAILFPAIELVLSILAFRGVNRDRKLLRSADRIR